MRRSLYFRGLLECTELGRINSGSYRLFPTQPGHTADRYVVLASNNVLMQMY
jgi:hypothetical protein